MRDSARGPTKRLQGITMLLACKPTKRSGVILLHCRDRKCQTWHDVILGVHVIVIYQVRGKYLI